MTYLERALADGHALMTDSGSGVMLTYREVGFTTRADTPEEKVRAEFWAELIYEYGYPVPRIGIEVAVPDRLPADRADLVVFADDQRRRPFAVIECKRDGITDGEFHQAIEQAVGNGTWSKLRASYVMVVAGPTRRTLDVTDNYGILERELNIVADLPRQYGRPQEYKYRRGQDPALRIVSKIELITALKKCHQSLWGGGRLSPPAAFAELSKLLFVKISDEQRPRRVGEPYAFQIRTYERAAGLAARVRKLYEEQQRRDPEVFSEGIRIPDETLITIVSHLESFDISATEPDVKGLAFETFMDGLFKGDFGQFFTPREVIRFAVAMLEPTVDDKVMDPACGSGGFLLEALAAVRLKGLEYWDDTTTDYYRYWHDFATNKLYGIEINEEIARIAKMNMILHGDGHTNVVSIDALEASDLIRDRNSGVAPGSFDLVLTNPPFGAVVRDNDSSYLSDYGLGRVHNGGGRDRVRRSQKTEILFIERVRDLLTPGTGRAAVVLPDGLLTNTTHQYVRDFLIEHFQLLAIVSLPQSAFMHYGATVKASVLFLRRRNLDEAPDESEEVFMALPELIGYDSVGRSTESELQEVLEAYRLFRSNGKR